RNHSKPRPDRHKVLPHGIPALIQKFPHQYGAVDFKIGVDEDLLQKMEAKYAPPDHPVFQLTPPEFNQRALYFLEHELHSPDITIHTFWDVYTSLLQLFQSETQNNMTLSHEVQEFLANEELINSEMVNLMEGQAELRYNGKVIGEEGLTDQEIANPFFRQDSENYFEVDFTDEEEEEKEMDGVDSDRSMLSVDFTDSEEEVEESLAV
ncbi:hypothetical protein FB446DRAFT_57405, partial [Lentinula raphanica]